MILTHGGKPSRLPVPNSMLFYVIWKFTCHCETQCIVLSLFSSLKIEKEIFPAGTDSRYLRAMGIPCLGFSPLNHTPILLHDHNERVNEKIFLTGIDIFVDVIACMANVWHFYRYCIWCNKDLKVFILFMNKIIRFHHAKQYKVYMYSDQWSHINEIFQKQ